MFANRSCELPNLTIYSREDQNFRLLCMFSIVQTDEPENFLVSRQLQMVKFWQ